MFKIICGQQCSDKCLSICRKTFFLPTCLAIIGSISS